MKPRVFVVEDDLDLLDLMCRLLAQWGYEVEGFSDGHVAYARMKRVAPDLVLVDLRMPAMNGDELDARMKCEAALAAVPVLFLTGSPERVARGRRYVLTKPVDAIVLRAALAARMPSSFEVA